MTSPHTTSPHRGVPVCAGLLRIFGPHMAELPLVATSATARRQGHCRVLMTAIEDQLQVDARLQVVDLFIPPRLPHVVVDAHEMASLINALYRLVLSYPRINSNLPCN